MPFRNLLKQLMVFTVPSKDVKKKKSKIIVGDFSMRIIYNNLSLFCLMK